MICPVRMTVSGMAVMSLCGGTKSACRHVSTPTLKLVMELRKSVESVVKTESYLEGEARSPLYRHALRIAGLGFRCM
jgi:hypothetical protein